MEYTVSQLARLAGVSIRTLRYYDTIGLLPARRGERNNEERLYGDDAVIRLQQILFYRELDFRLDAIAALLDDPAFDVRRALREQKAMLQARRTRVDKLLHTIDGTLDHLEGRGTMTNTQFFDGFDPAQYEEEARERWGRDVVDESMRRWSSYSGAQQAQIVADGEEIFAAVHRSMHEGVRGGDVQRAMESLHAYVNRFWNCDLQAFRGLGDLYVTDPRFRVRFEAMDPALPEFLRAAMAAYADARAGECASG